MYEWQGRSQHELMTLTASNAQHLCKCDFGLTLNIQDLVTCWTVLHDS